MEAEAKAGTLQPNDYTDINHSFSFAAGAVISTAADLATWIEALAGGKVLDAEYQRIWQDSAQDHRPQELLQLVRVRHRPAALGTRHASTSTAARPPASTRRRSTTPTNDMTLVIWANLTMSLDNQFTAEVLMLKVLDQIYVKSPLPPAPPTTGTPTSQK